MILPIHEQVRARVHAVLGELYGLSAADATVSIEYPPNRTLGDLGTPVAFELARRLRKAPRAIAQEIAGALGPQPGDRAANEIGRFVAHLATLRRMSTSVAGMLDRGAQPAVEAALVKDIGTAFEREIPEVFRHLIATEPSLGDGQGYAELLGMAMLRAPGFTIRGGTREILRGMIARGLGLR